MDPMQIKENIFKDRYENGKFPEYRRINGKEAIALKKEIFKKFNLNSHIDILGIANGIEPCGREDEAGFEFKKYEKLNSVESQYYYINFGDYQEIFEIERGALNKHFSDVFFGGGPDDVEIISRSIDYMFVVNHESEIYFIKSSRE
ncbi:MAG: hypothetical protein ABJN04_12990 [Hyphomicrobiales bacterium]